VSNAESDSDEHTIVASPLGTEPLDRATLRDLYRDWKEQGGVTMTNADNDPMDSSDQVDADAVSADDAVDEESVGGADTTDADVMGGGDGDDEGDLMGGPDASDSDALS
jgi:hypothetical protein